MRGSKSSLATLHPDGFQDQPAMAVPWLVIHWLCEVGASTLPRRTSELFEFFTGRSHASNESPSLHRSSVSARTLQHIPGKGGRVLPQYQDNAQGQVHEAKPVFPNSNSNLCVGSLDEVGFFSFSKIYLYFLIVGIMCTCECSCPQSPEHVRSLDVELLEVVRC